MWYENVTGIHEFEVMVAQEPEYEGDRESVRTMQHALINSKDRIGPFADRIVKDVETGTIILYGFEEEIRPEHFTR